METRTEGMENENQKFQEAIAYFSQKLHETGALLTRDDYFCDRQFIFAYMLPKSETGNYMTLFLDFDLDEIDHLNEKGFKRTSLAEIASEDDIPLGRGQVLVQSDGCEEIVTFKFEGDRIVPDSKNSLSRKYAEKLEKLVCAKEGIDLAFEVYRSQSERD